MTEFNEDDVCQNLDFVEMGNRRYEDQVIAHLLNRYDLGSEVRYRLRRDGDGRMTFDGFHEAFPDFPVTMAARRWRKMRENNRVADIFGDFPKRNFTKAWHDAREQVSGGVAGSFGLVFHWPYLRGQRVPVSASESQREAHGGFGLVVWDGDPDWCIPGVRIVAVSSANVRLTVTPFSVFLNEIDARYGAEGWQP